MAAHTYILTNKLLRGVAGFALCIAISAPAAHAQRAHFVYTGKLVTWTVPKTGLFKITAYGAQGGDVVFSANVTAAGGLGAEIDGDFTLTVGETLQIAVGGAGSNGGGGGGSFVVDTDNNPLIVAGGGGGGGVNLGGRILPAGDGLTGTNGGSAGGGAGGTNGKGGGVPPNDPGAGGGGAGFLSAGATNVFDDGGTGGGVFPDLTGGSVGGGFGGGGGAGTIGLRGSGGGGGYSGGGGGFRSPGGHGAGGGGGSFDGGINQILNAGVQTGDGEVIVKAIFVGTPGKRNCHGEVVSHLAKRYRDLDDAAAALGYSSVQILESDIATYCAG